MEATHAVFENYMCAHTRSLLLQPQMLSMWLDSCRARPRKSFQQKTLSRYQAEDIAGQAEITIPVPLKLGPVPSSGF